jgi:hypothetical protein
MQTIYTDMLTKWKSGGGTLINQYTFCDPSWGLLEYQDQDTSLAPAYLAAMHFIRGNPRWWTETRAAACSSTGIRDLRSAHSALSGAVKPLMVKVDLRTGKQIIRVTGAAARVGMFGITGSSTPLVETAPGVYMPVGNIAKGCYFVRVKGAGNPAGTVRVVTGK